MLYAECTGFCSDFYSDAIWYGCFIAFLTFSTWSTARVKNSSFFFSWAQASVISFVAFLLLCTAKSSDPLALLILLNKLISIFVIFQFLAKILTGNIPFCYKTLNFWEYYRINIGVLQICQIMLQTCGESMGLKMHMKTEFDQNKMPKWNVFVLEVEVIKVRLLI